MKKLMSITVAAGLSGLLLALGAAPASAHEERKVGNYMFHVGFGDEPAYAGAKNSVQVLIHDDPDPLWSYHDATPARGGHLRSESVTAAPAPWPGRAGQPGEKGEKGAKGARSLLGGWCTRRACDPRPASRASRGPTERDR